MPDRDYPHQPCPTASEDEALDAKTMRERIAAREAASERFRKLKEKLLAPRESASPTPQPERNP